VHLEINNESSEDFTYKEEMSLIRCHHGLIFRNKQFAASEQAKKGQWIDNWYKTQLSWMIEVCR
jgi:hypothetical protein